MRFRPRSSRRRHRARFGGHDGHETAASGLSWLLFGEAGACREPAGRPPSGGRQRSSMSATERPLRWSGRRRRTRTHPSGRESGGAGGPPSGRQPEPCESSLGRTGGVVAADSSERATTALGTEHLRVRRTGKTRQSRPSGRRSRRRREGSFGTPTGDGPRPIPRDESQANRFLESVDPSGPTPTRRIGQQAALGSQANRPGVRAGLRTRTSATGPRPAVSCRNKSPREHRAAIGGNTSDLQRTLRWSKALRSRKRHQARAQPWQHGRTPANGPGPTARGHEVAVNPFIWGDASAATGEGKASEGVAPLGKAPLACKLACRCPLRGTGSARHQWVGFGRPASAERTSWKHGEPHGRLQGATNLRGSLRGKPSKS